MRLKLIEEHSKKEESITPFTVVPTYFPPSLSLSETIVNCSPNLIANFICKYLGLRVVFTVREDKRNFLKEK